jgi:hypothetical protein
MVAHAMSTNPRTGLTMTRQHGTDTTTWRLTLSTFDLTRMSARQAADLRVGLMLLQAATLPDGYFDGHASADPDSVDSLMDRVAIMSTLEDVRGLPEHDPH